MTTPWKDSYDTGLPVFDDIAGGLGVPGPPGAGVPSGGAAFQLIRKNAANTTTEWASPDKSMVGLSNVDNTSDANKPVSTAAQAALDAKAPRDSPAFTGTVTGVTKSMVGLGNVDNTTSPGIVIAAEPGGGDDTTALNALLTSGAGKTVQLKAGRTYVISNTLTIPSNTRFDLNGATLDARTIPAGTTLGQRIAITSTGSLGSDITVGTAITQWSRTVAGISSTTGLAAGDLILISNDEQPVPGMTRTDRDKGELNIIQSVDSGTQITLVTGAVFAYGATGLKLRKVTPVEDVTIKDGKILLGGVGSAHNAIQIRYGRNITVIDMSVSGAEDIAVGLNTVYNGRVTGGDVRDSTSSATLGNTGYGVAIVEGSKHIVLDGIQFYNCRHFVAGGGYWPPAFVDVINCHGERSSDAGYDCHESTLYWTFTKNTAVGVASGFIIRGQYITVDGNDVTDSLGRAYRAATFDGVTEQRGIRIINNKARQCVYGIEVDGQAAGAEPNCLKIDVEISGNTLRNAGANPILLRHFDGAEVADNKVLGSTSHAVLILGLSGTQSKTLTLADNQVRGAGLDGIKIQYVDDVEAAGGQIITPGNHGLEVLNCNRTSFAGVSVRTPAFSGMFISAGAVHSVDGAMISGGEGSSYDAIRVTGTSDVTVTGGYLASARWAVYTTTTDYVVVAGVNARGAVNAGKISCDATNKVVANNLV